MLVMKTQKTVLLSCIIYGLSITGAPVFLALPANAESVEDIEEDVSKIEKKLKKEEAELTSLNQDLTQIKSSLTSTQQLIYRVQNLLSQTKQTIEQKEQEISSLEKQLELEKKVLTSLVRELYFSNTVPLVEVLLSGADLVSLFQNKNHLVSTQEKLHQVVVDINEMKDKVAHEKNNLEDTKKDHEELLVIQNRQKQALVSEKSETESEVREQQATIAELQEKLQELKSDLSKLTGKSYDAKDIREAVEFASKQTGVPKGVLYGFLKMETNLGANTGQCTYKKVVSDALPRYKKLGYKKSIDLMYKRQDLFYDLVKKLGYNKEKKVSCTPKSYVGQGGAMGVSQFMSDVWLGYESQVRAKTGHSKPDPWSLTDGVMAMALKLKKAGATSDKSSAIKSASINYLGGFNKGYYEGIVYWSKNYKNLFD